MTAHGVALRLDCILRSGRRTINDHGGGLSGGGLRLSPRRVELGPALDIGRIALFRTVGLAFVVVELPLRPNLLQPLLSGRRASARSKADCHHHGHRAHEPAPAEVEAAYRECPR
jgi:hypothetical protein